LAQRRDKQCRAVAVPVCPEDSRPSCQGLREAERIKRWMSLRILVYVALPLFSAAAAEPRDYLGAQTCSACHPAQTRLQASSGHAFALRPAAEHPQSRLFFREGRRTRPPDFVFQFQKDFLVRISNSTAQVDVPIEWAFGAGSQAVTLVSRVNAGSYIEHFFSYYRALNGLAPTPGQRELKPAGLAEAAGLYYKTRDPNIGIDGCFECHTTGPLQFAADNTIRPFELGVRCESCHGAGRKHVEAASRRNGEVSGAIGNPGRLSAVAQLEFCGRCHRPPGRMDSAIDWSSAWNVRHQPPYLAESECFRKSNGALSCLTCHRPHEPLQRSSEAYNVQCWQCHKQPPEACATNCIDCHMPLVSPEPPLRFTNHRIGVYDSAAKLTPRRRSPR